MSKSPEVLVQCLVRAVAYQQVAQSPCSILFPFHSIPWLLCDVLEIGFSKLVFQNGFNQWVKDALDLMESRSNASSSGRLCHSSGVPKQHDPVFDIPFHHAGGYWTAIAGHFGYVFKSVFPQWVVNEILVA